MTNFKHNFNAGPSILPHDVINLAKHAVANWDNQGLSILEVSHRTPEFRAVVEELQDLIRELLLVPSDYSILFLQGGASTQFSMIPFNFMGVAQKAAYIETGFFSERAIADASCFGKVQIAASSKHENYRSIPNELNIDADCAYLHCTSNNTIEGTQMQQFPLVDIPLMCDMSSDILSKPINVNQFGLIYAGAQKNMGPAGVTVVIVKNDLLDKNVKRLPAMWDYRTFRQSASLYNTPPVYALYVMLLNLRWVKLQGGVVEMDKRNTLKANLVYQALDCNSLFTTKVKSEFRSKMNICFNLVDPDLAETFQLFMKNKGIVGFNSPFGDGYRVSLYNAMPISSVNVLVSALNEFCEIYEPQALEI